MSKKSNRIVLDVYEQQIYPIEYIYVAKRYTDKQINKLFHIVDKDNNELNINCDGPFYARTQCVIRNNDGMYAILILLADDIKDDIKGLGICAHEAVHAASDILNYADIQHTDDTEEVYAYLIEWITKCIITTLKKKK